MNSFFSNPLKVGGTVITAILLLFLAFASTYQLDEYERGVVTTMGQFSGTTGPGFHFKTPILDSVHVADTRINKISYPELKVATKDGQTIGVSLTINHRINESESNLQNLYEQFGNRFDYEPRILRELAIDRVKSVMGNYPMEEFMAKRSEIRHEALQSVIESVREYGIHIVDVQISDLQFSPRYRERLEEVAEQRAEAAKAQQAARREGFLAEQAVAKAKGEAQSQRERADAEAYAKRQQADANAHARKVQSIEDAAAIRREGEAKANALQVQAEALASSESGALVELTKAEGMKNWDGSSVPQVIIQGGSDGSATSMIPFMNIADMTGKK